MKDTEFKILDILSREIDNPISIRKITERINDTHCHAPHYPEIYSKTQELARKRIIGLDTYGRSSAV